MKHFIKKINVLIYNGIRGICMTAWLVNNFSDNGAIGGLKYPSVSIEVLLSVISALGVKFMCFAQAH